MARRRRGKQTPQQIALGIGLPVIVVFVYFASRGGSTSLLHIFPLIVFLVVVAVVVVVCPLPRRVRWIGAENPAMDTLEVHASGHGPRDF